MDATLLSCRSSRPSKVSTKLRVLLVDDHPLFRHGISRLIDHEPDLETCGEAASFGAALSVARQSRPSVALIDISMPGTNGLELIKALKSEHPPLRMLALSMHDESLYAVRTLRAGAMGYVMKSEPSEVVLAAIRRIASGRLFLNPELEEKLVFFAMKNLAAEDAHPNLEMLSSREREVLELYGRGHTTQEICEQLHVGCKTVETYRTRIKEKLGLSNMAELKHFAVNWVLQRE